MKSSSLFFLWLGIWCATIVTASFMSSTMDEEMPLLFRKNGHQHMKREHNINAVRGKSSKKARGMSMGYKRPYYNFTILYDNQKFCNDWGRPPMHKAWSFLTHNPKSTIKIRCDPFFFWQCYYTGAHFYSDAFDVMLNQSKYAFELETKKSTAVIYVETKRKTRAGKTLKCCLTASEPTSNDDILTDPAVCRCGRQPYFKAPSIPPSQNMMGMKYTMVQRDQFPWIAEIRLRSYPSVPFRTGVILCSRFIMTAAHFLLPYSAQDIYVIVGQLVSGPTSTIAVKKIIMHPSYNGLAIGRRRFQNDVVLICLEHAINYDGTNIKPICLPPRKMRPHGMVLDIVTFAKDATEGKRQYLTAVDGLSKAKCQEKKTNATSSTLCASNNETSLCSVDGGGAVMLQTLSRFYLVGILGDEDDCEFGIRGATVIDANVMIWALRELSTCILCPKSDEGGIYY